MFVPNENHGRRGIHQAVAAFGYSTDKGDAKDTATIKINSQILTRTVFILLVVLLLFYFIGQYIRITTDYDNVIGFIPLFDLNGEGNVPTWISSALLFLSSVVLLSIALFKQGGKAQFKGHWIGLSAIFALLSIDESAQIHEKVAVIVDRLFESVPALQIGSALPLALLTLAVGFSYFRFLRSLPKKSMILFIVSGSIYISGALFVDYIAGGYFSGIGGGEFVLVILHAVEEVLEIAGLTLFLFCLLDYCSATFCEIKVILQ